MTSKPLGMVSLMSNAKWRKFFAIVAGMRESIWRARWKLVDEDNPCYAWMPLSEDVWESQVDNCFNGPIDYSKIEWIEIPYKLEFRKYDHAPVSFAFQNIDKLLASLELVGQFPLEKNESNIRIYGYK